jgi:hypothetical protein
MPVLQNDVDITLTTGQANSLYNKHRVLWQAECDWRTLQVEANDLTRQGLLAQAAARQNQADAKKNVCDNHYTTYWNEVQSVITGAGYGGYTYAGWRHQIRLGGLELLAHNAPAHETEIALKLPKGGH